MCISLHTYINNLIIHKQLKPCICQKDPNASFQLQSLLATLNSMKWVWTSDHSHEKKHGKGITVFPDCQVLAEINWTHLHGWDLNPSHIIAFSTLSERGRVTAVSWGIMHCQALQRKLDQMASKPVATWICGNLQREHVRDWHYMQCAWRFPKIRDARTIT